MDILYSPANVVFKPILSNEERAYFHALSAAYPLQKFMADARNFEEMTIDFVYTSAKIEGNTYDRLDTDNLLRLGITSGGKRYSDATMLINLRGCFNHVMTTPRSVDHDYLGELHKILMRDLLPVHEQGIGRDSPVTIGGSKYRPLPDATTLRTELKFILGEAEKYEDAFEKSIYLHCNLAYLQYFRDGNKRAARMAQTASLVKDGHFPLFFNDDLIADYKRATVHYYETGDYAPYASFFCENHTLVIARLLGQNQEDLKQSIMAQMDCTDPVSDDPPTNT